MTGHFVSPIQIRYFFRMNPVFFLKSAAVQMKCPTDPVFIKDPDQSAVLDPTVIITHCQRLVFSTRITAIDFIHFFFLFI